MNLQIRSKNITLNDATKAHIENAIEAFRKYSLDITSIVSVITAEKQGVKVEFEIQVSHAQPVIITQNDDSLDAAIDLAIDKGTKALRRLHDKVVDHKNGSVKDLETLDA